MTVPRVPVSAGGGGTYVGQHPVTLSGVPMLDDGGYLDRSTFKEGVPGTCTGAMVGVLTRTHRDVRSRGTCSDPMEGC